MRLLFASCISLTTYAQTLPTSSPFIDPRDTVQRQLAEEQRRMIDPATGTVPYERITQAREKLTNDRRLGTLPNQGGIPNITWQERGPNNSYDARVVLADPNDPAKKKVWAGLAVGGLWYNNDITNPASLWTPVNNDIAAYVVGALATDPSNSQIMYAGTGDTNYTIGAGIWKTTDGGQTWSRLSSTVPNDNSPSLSRSFDYVSRIIVNNSGHVFVASRYGVIKSTDGGASWQNILAPNQGIGFGTATGNSYNDLVSDLEIASDGILYASFWPSRVFKSTNVEATAWTEITPPGTTGERSELTLVQSTNGAGQVLYAVSRQYNSTRYEQDISWFKKSTDAGATWTNVPIPTFSWGGHFTEGNGYRYMTLTAHPTRADVVFAGGGGLFRSTDGGANWMMINGAGNTLYNQTATYFLPSSDDLVDIARQAIYYLPAAGSPAVTNPTSATRSEGLRAALSYSLAMKNSPGNNYFLANLQPMGFTTTNSAGIGKVGNYFLSTSSLSVPYIDTDEPSIQLISGYSSLYIFNGNTFQTLPSFNYNSFVADYDSQANTLYVCTQENNRSIIRRTTGVGATPVSTTITLADQKDQPTYLKLSPDGSTLFVGCTGGKLYKLTSLNQPTPTSTRIDDGAFGQVSVSCIDIGASTSELLVTFSNFGVQSVWYTADGGANWQGKDLISHGLPDIPVRSALFNPQNRQQVLLGTDLGLWTTTTITAANPTWAFSDGLPALRVNQLRHRPTDGKLAAATVGRGIWTTDAFAIPYTIPTITVTNVSSRTLCAGSELSISFTTSGTFNSSNSYEVWVSDGAGDFTTQRLIGRGSSSPISATLPMGYDALSYGTGYRVKVLSTNPEVASTASDPLIIGNIDSAFIRDRADNNGMGVVCLGARATLTVLARSTDYSPITDIPLQYRWAKDSILLDGATSASLTTTQAGFYSCTVTNGACSVRTGNYQVSHSSSASFFISSSSSVTPQCAGQRVALRTTYIGDNATYQWKRDGAVISGATSSTYSATQTGRYSAQMQDGGCASEAGSSYSYYEFGTSITASIYFSSARDTVVCSANQGSYIYLDNSGSYTAIQWYKNGVAINGATQSSVFVQGEGVFYAVVQLGNCQTVSNTLVRKLGTQLPVIISYDGARKLCPGESRSLYAERGYGLSLQWQRNGIDIPGAIYSNYPVSSSGDYTVRVDYNGNCATTSATQSFTFSTAIVPLVKTASGLNQACAYNYLYQSGGNDGSYSFQWLKDNVPITGATYSALTATTTGLYSLSMTNGTCSGVSKGVYIQTGALPKPVVTLYSSTPDRCANAAILLRADVYTTPLQWKRNGVVIPNAPDNQYYATQSGRYVLVQQQDGCTAESDPVDIRIGEPTAATLTGSALVNAGQTAVLPITFSGAAPWSVTLSNGQTVGGIVQSPYSLSVVPTTTTTYSLATLANACGPGTASGNGVVTVGSGKADLALAMAVSNRTPKLGDLVSFSINATNEGPDEATGVQLQSRLPAGLQFAPGGSAGVTYSNGLVSIPAGTVPAQSSQTYVFQANVTSPGTLATAVQIAATQTPDPDSQPNSGTGDGQDDIAIADIRTADQTSDLWVVSANPNQVPLPQLRSSQPTPNPAAVALSLQLSLDKLLVDVAQQEVVTTTLTVRNQGGLRATSVIVRVQLPNGVLAPASQTGWQVVDSQMLNGLIPTIPAGGVATLKLLWKPTAAGELKAQIADVIEPVVGSAPGNGYGQGETDEAQASIRIR
ncbi:hypothetical protein ACAW74_23665 [Fibrella sp. WM1]|uniref:hypothetical protein n=1 Tax=Fibrella musci TaxID=3242485 RepID=UPI00351FF3AC